MTQLIEIRTNILPILEAGGVDLVLTGHSHSYERSFLLNGHYGSSATLTPAMKLDAGSGREGGTGAYEKPAGLAGNQGAVYAVAGNGGHVTNWVGGSTAEFNPAPHPAMFMSVLHLGSMVLDVDGNRLDAKMIRETGAVDDYFTILKNVANTPPSVSLTSPAAGATFTAPANITIAANATDSGGSIVQVDFRAGDTVIASDTTAPYAITWSNVAAGTYALTASATDNLGATTTSAAVNITVNPAPAPAPPTNLAAAAVSATQINLAWTDGANNETGFLIERSANGSPFTQIASVGSNVTTFASTGLTANKRYYYRVRATNAAGNSAYSNTANARTPK